MYVFCFSQISKLKYKIGLWNARVLCILFYRRRDSPTPFTLDDDAFGKLIDVSKTGVCGESIGLLPTNELSNQNFLQITQKEKNLSIKSM